MTYNKAHLIQQKSISCLRRHNNCKIALTTTTGRAGGLLARTGSLNGHSFKQQPRSKLLDLIIYR
ncbi:hypothetical protein J6590_095426 [Homalodisca vitripennis]|nr:hypothetical protein J6590_095426 [Homalodisca vitripennis]